jgi:hypothetical protein
VLERSHPPCSANNRQSINLHITLLLPACSSVSTDSFLLGLLVTCANDAGLWPRKQQMWEIPPSYYYCSLRNTGMFVSDGSYVDAVPPQAAHLAMAPELLRGGVVTCKADSLGAWASWGLSCGELARRCLASAAVSDQ